MQLQHIDGLDPCLGSWEYKGPKRSGRINCPKCGSKIYIEENVVPVNVVGLCGKDGLTDGFLKRLYEARTASKRRL